jgi:histidyl-tRNA synthetase
MKKEISTESYKGVRDFYPEDMFVQNFIFGVWRSVAESFGYCQYDASVLEPAELYRAKSGEEIVGEQTYTFTDRGDREVTLRPEMTPTVARMVAGKDRDLSFPLRWYSIPNLFRYEKPQRGRLREHWQLNVDIFGVDSVFAEVEVNTLASRIMKKFGANDSDFVIKINSRKILDDLFAHFDLSDEQKQKVSKIIDKKEKIPADTFRVALEEIIGEQTPEMIALLIGPEKLLDMLGNKNNNATELVSVIEKLSQNGVTNVVFSPALMRGFDYYTGIVFEVFDTHPENNRSVFGGGRYDDLLDIFGKRKIPAFGFGAGDVTARDFLETHDLLPQYKSPSDIFICSLKTEYIDEASILAEKLRSTGVNVVINISDKKLGDQIKLADKQKIPFVIVLGEDEIKSGLYPLKNLSTGDEKKVRVEEIAGEIKIK